MPLTKYQDFNFRPKSLEIIDKANSIIAEYSAAGYDLTLRQIYYQFVARGIIPNSDKEYKKLGSVINDGRLAGMIDWDSITDRTRPSRGIQYWGSPQEIITAIGKQFHIDTRADQEYYIEVWVEKDALIGVLERICTQLDVPYFSCRGYVSQSSMWEAAQRFIEQEENDRKSLLIHLGDHDPSGIDMSRDIQERLALFESRCDVFRVALTEEQIEQYNPPPNPAKITDSRYAGYIEKYDENCWELDALEPQVISELIEDAVNADTDKNKQKALIKIQNQHRLNILKVAHKWESVVEEI
jgi:hypothetical protein